MPFLALSDVRQTTCHPPSPPRALQFGIIPTCQVFLFPTFHSSMQGVERLSQETRVPLCRIGGKCAGFRAKTVEVSGHLPAGQKTPKPLVILHCVDSPQFNGVAFKLDAHTHFAARVRSADIEETPLNSSHRRRRTKAKEEVTRGSRKLKPITPPLKGKGLHTLLFLMRPFPHGVLDTSAESIPNFETTNKVLTHFLAMLTQFSAKFRCET